MFDRACMFVYGALPMRTYIQDAKTLYANNIEVVLTTLAVKALSCQPGIKGSLSL